MKKFICCVLIVLQLTCTIIAFPNDDRTVISSHPDNDAETVSIPLRKSITRDAVTTDDDDDDDGFAIGGPIGGGAGIGGGFGGSPFGGVDILSGNGNNNGPSLSSWFPSTFQQPYNFNMNFGFNGFQDLFRSLWQTATSNSYDFGGLDTSPSAKDGEANTTSTIKIIDGKKYIINDTVYTKVSPFGQSVYKIRTVDVQDCNDDADDDKKDETTTGANDEKKEPAVPVSTTVSSSPALAESVDKGSPEILEANNRHNEISKEISDEDTDDLLKKDVF